jgi:hypothetical protein
MEWEEILAAFGELIDEVKHAFRVTIPMNSTAIEQLEYDTDTGELSVTMTDGSEWPYPAPGRPAITTEQVQAWVNAPSQGAFFNFNVRGKW